MLCLGPTKEFWFYHPDMLEGDKRFPEIKPAKLERFALVAKWWNNR